MARFFDHVRAHERRLVADASDPDDLGAEQVALPPQRGSAVPVGAGKTRATLAALVQFVEDMAAPWPRRAAFFAANHRLAREIAADLASLAPNVSVATVAGQSQPDPSALGETMCRRADFMASARREGASIDRVCRSCPLRDRQGGPAGCGYRGQRPAAKNAQIVVFAGNAGLGDPVPDWLERDTPVVVSGATVHRGQFDAIVIDEPVLGQLVHGLDRTELAATCLHLGTILSPDFLDPAGFPPTADEDTKIVGARASCAPVLRALAAGRGRVITHADLAAAGVGAEADAWHLWRVAIGAKAEPKAWEENPTPEDAARRAHNAQVLPVAGVFAALAAWFAKGHTHGPHEACAAVVRDELAVPGGAKVPVLAYRWQDPIHGDWGAPTLVLDATANDEILRAWFPGLVTGRTAYCKPPAGVVHVRQVFDQSLGYSRLGTLGAPFAERVARHVEIEAAKRRGRGLGGVDALLIGPKSFIASVKRVWGGKPPTGVDVAWFGAVRGLNKWKGIAHMTVVSRPLPPLDAMEELASVVGGRGVVPLRDWTRAAAIYAMVDGTARRVADVVPRHADPRAEAFRKAACDDELLQAIGRARANRRTSPGELGIDVLTNLPVEGLVVDELVKLDDLLAPADALVLGLAARGVIVDPTARGAWTAVAGLLRGDVTQADTVRKSESRRVGAGDAETLAAIEARGAWTACGLRFPDAPRYAVACRVRGVALSEVEATVAEVAVLGGLATPPSVEVAAGRAKRRRALTRTNALNRSLISECPREAHASATAPEPTAPPAAAEAEPATIVIDRDCLVALGHNLGLARPTVRRLLDTLRPIERRDGLDAAAKRGIDLLIGETVRRGTAHPAAIRAAVAGLVSAA